MGALDRPDDAIYLSLDMLGEPSVKDMSALGAGHAAGVVRTAQNSKN
jgi:hypothetical protein